MGEARRLWSFRTVAKLAAKDTGKIGKKERSRIPIFPVAGRTQPKPSFWPDEDDRERLRSDFRLHHLLD